MAVEIEKGNLSINQAVTKMKEIVTIEGDCIVPDVKPDIINIIGTSGIVSIYKKEVSNGKIRIDGCVSVYVMYKGIEENKDSVRSINHILDFSQIVAVPEAKQEMIDLGCISLDNIECRMINERKINIKANLNCETELVESTSIEYIKNINVKDLQKQGNSVNVNSLIGIGNTKTTINEKIHINDTENLAEILRVNTTIKDIDTKISYNKILIKADVNVKTLYSTSDEKFNVTNSTFPVMGFVDMNDVSEENVITPNIEIRNILIKPAGSQDHSITIDIEVGMQVAVYGNQEINIVKDMYSPSTDFLFTQKKVTAIQNTQVIKSVMNFNHKELIEIGNEKIYDVDISTDINNIKVLSDGVEINGNMKFEVIHSENKMSSLGFKTVEVPFKHRILCERIEPNTFVKIKTDINNENINIMPGGEVEFRMDVNFMIETSNTTDVELVDSVEENEKSNSNNYNLIIYYTKQSDNLWQIAKKFRTTQEEIKKENSLSDEQLNPGTQLFITSYLG